MTTERRSTGRFATGHAHRYMTQLCKHFGHKLPATVEGDKGTITFETGTAHLLASDTDLHCTVAGANTDAAEHLQGVIDSHLERFAFREGFTRMDWLPAA